MKREIEMYVDVFKEKSGKISCNVLYQGKCYLIRNKSLDAYVDEILKLRAHTMCTRDDVIKIYVDIRGIGYAMYDMLSHKCDAVYKLEYEKYDKTTVHVDNKQGLYAGIDMGSGWKVENAPTIGCENIKINNGSVSEKDVEKIIDKKLNEKINCKSSNFVAEFEKIVNVKFE